MKNILKRFVGKLEGKDNLEDPHFSVVYFCILLPVL
jgi:hypothetical protein